MSTEHPYGLGPLAEVAAEPIEFTRLIRHIETGELVDDTGAWPACGGACAESARPCPAPRRCWLVEKRDDGEGRGALLWPLAVGVVTVLALIVIAIA